MCFTSSDFIINSKMTKSQSLIPVFFIEYDKKEKNEKMLLTVGHFCCITVTESKMTNGHIMFLEIEKERQESENDSENWETDCET